MVVKAASDAWLAVSTDEQRQFEGFLRSGEERTWEATRTLWLRTGNAGGTEVTINGQPVAPLGARGDVVEKRWRLLPDGLIEQSS
jgi:hypothetical protein